MLKILSKFSLIIILSCSNIQKRSNTTIDKVSGKTSKKNEEAKEETNLPILSTIAPGKIKLIELSSNDDLLSTSVVCGGRRVLPFKLKENYYFFVGESYFSSRKKFKCYAKNAKIQKELVNFSVVPYEYPSEKLNVDMKKVFLSKKDLARVQRENAMLAKIYKKTHNEPLFNTPFKIPLDSKVTSIYGSKRLFNNKKQSQHLGWDFRAAVGVPIPASNDGQVVFTGDLFYSGNVVIVDHGVGIFSIYGHLSKILVKAGDFIKQGQIIGHAGATGRVSGPHLHWGIKMNNDNLDGISLVESSKILFDD